MTSGGEDLPSPAARNIATSENRSGLADFKCGAWKLREGKKATPPEDLFIFIEPIAGHRSRACCPLRADGGIREVEAITSRT
jgi:hypothetical protein